MSTEKSCHSVAPDTDGAEVDIEVGVFVKLRCAKVVGITVGADDGTLDGTEDGTEEGTHDGTADGIDDGTE